MLSWKVYYLLVLVVDFTISKIVIFLFNINNSSYWSKCLYSFFVVINSFFISFSDLSSESHSWVVPDSISSGVGFASPFSKTSVIKKYDLCFSAVWDRYSITVAIFSRTFILHPVSSRTSLVSPSRIDSPSSIPPPGRVW